LFDLVILKIKFNLMIYYISINPATFYLLITRHGRHGIVSKYTSQNATGLSFLDCNRIKNSYELHATLFFENAGSSGI
jgi:hypothetical protein